MSTMSIVNGTVLCPGQGAQAVGMGQAWSDASEVAKAVFDEADAVLGDTLGAPLSTLCFTGPSEALNKTNVSQPAIYTCSVACWRALHGDARPAVAAGLSLGEWTALHLAGAFSFADGLKLVATRGSLMQSAAEACDGGMVALMGPDESEAEVMCQEIVDAQGGVLVPANLNAPGQVVISGDAAACEQAVAVCAERGWRATPLTVAGAFHSAHMTPAAESMAEVLSETPITAPMTEVWSNVTAAPYPVDDVDAMRALLVAQITSPVRWSAQMAAMVAAGKTGWTELAPGKVLRGLMRRIDRGAKVVNHDQPDTTATT